MVHEAGCACGFIRDTTALACASVPEYTLGGNAPSVADTVGYMFGVEAEWRVLSCGFDELNLWDLPGRHAYIRAAGTAVTPDISLDDARAALVAALSQGLVELYDRDESGYPALPLDQGLALIAEDDEWNPDTASRRICLSITPTGAQQSHVVFARLRAASPFGAAGATDPV